MAARCGACGRVNPAGAGFCTGCGRALAAKQAPAANFCTRCGAPRSAGANSCTKCGSARRRRAPRAAFAVLAVLAVGGGAWVLRGGGGTGSGGAGGVGVASGAIRLEMPAGMPPTSVTPATDLARVRAIPGGSRLLAAGRFEPSGLAIPGGARVTFTLAEPRPAGGALPMFVLDQAQVRWRPTGEMARVLAGGTQAEGRITHFSDHAVGEEEHQPLLVGRGVLVRPTNTVDRVRLDAALKAYDEKVVGGEMTLDAMKAIYAAGDFHVVKTLIEDGKISAQHSMDMADLRILMIFQTLERLAAKRGWRIYRSDSGNQSSGMSSDVDQTVYVERREGEAWVRHEAGDAALASEFPAEFLADHHLPVDVFDIATIAGRDKYPDHRTSAVQLDAEGRRSFRQHARETMFTLRRTPGAYTFCGAVVQQMQLRVRALVDASLRAGRDGAVPAEPRPVHRALAAHNPEFRLNQLVCLSIGPDEDGVGPVRAREAFQEDALRILFDGLPPRLLRGHCYDAAVANYFAFMHHVNDPYPAVKYLLRALDDGLSRLHSLSSGTQRAEYATLDDAGRRSHLAKVLGPDLAAQRWDGSSFLDRWKAAFDVSAELRKLHSGLALNPESAANAFRGLAVEIAIRHELSALHASGVRAADLGPIAWRARADEVARRVREDPAAWRAHLDAARAEYDQRCQEFMLHNMLATARERVAEFLSPDGEGLASQELLGRVLDEGPLRKQLNLEGPANEERWMAHRDEFLRNHAFQAEMQLLYSFREMRSTRPDLLKMMLADAARTVSAEDMARLQRVADLSGKWYFPLVEAWHLPRAVSRFAYLAGKRNVLALAEGVQNRVLSEVGWIDDGSPRPSDLLAKLGLHGLHERARLSMAASRGGGVIDRFLGKAFLHPGTIQSGVAALRAYSESDGDPAVLEQAFARELVNLTPLVGLAVGATEAGTDWKAQVLVWAPMVSPTAGMILLAYALGEHALVIYQHEISRPIENTTADVIYRGYVGPSQYQFAAGAVPPQFTDADGLQLQDHIEHVNVLMGRMLRGEGTDADARDVARHGRDLRLLQERQAAWLTYVREDTMRQEGGALFGQGGFAAQRAVDLPRPPAEFEGHPGSHAGSLYERFEPLVFYAPDPAYGPVDFRVKGLTPVEERRRTELEALLQAPQLPSEWLALKAEHEALRDRKRERERADRYLAEAASNRELAHQFRRDSLWPNLLAHPGETPNLIDTRNYVEQWISMRKEILLRRLEQLGISDPRPFLEETRQALVDRVLADIDRSRSLWEAGVELMEARAKMAHDARLRAVSVLDAERAMLSAIERPLGLSDVAAGLLRMVGLDPREAVSPATMGRAYLERHLPETAPTLELGLRRVAKEATGDGPPGWEYRPEAKVEADPQVYVPPYVAVSHPLNPVQVRAALAAGSWKGLPLSDDMRAAMEAHLQRVGPVAADFDPAKHEFTPCVLTYAFCSDVRIPVRVVEETVAHLPRPARVEIPLPDGMPPLPEALRSGHLLGGGALIPPVELIEGQVRISKGTSPYRSHDVIEVHSEALSKLESEAQGGLLFEVQRATTEAGLEAAKPVARELVTAATPVVADLAPGRGGRWATDRLRIVAPDPAEDEPRGPYFYRVLQVQVTGPDVSDAAPRGTPTKSNVLGPKPEVRVDLEPLPGQADTFSADGLSSLPVGLGVAEQEHLVWGAHVRVRARGGTWHYWSPRLAGTRRVGGDPHGGAWVRVPLADVADDVEFEIEAEGSGMKASRRVKLVAPPDARERLAQRERMHADERQRATEDVEQRRQNARRRLEGAQSALADFQRRHAGQGWHGEQSIANAEMDLREAQSAAEIQEQVDGPEALALLDQSRALARADPAAQVAALRRRVALRQAWMSLRQTFLQAQAAQLGSLAGASPDENSRRHYRGRVENLQAQVAHVEDEAHSRLRDLCLPLGLAALQAGDGAACRDARALEVKALDHLKQRGLMRAAEHAEARGRLFITLADEMACLTGNRALSRTLLEEGRRWLLEGTAPEGRAALEAAWEREPLPAWWPE